ncbi:MAG: hypothetical protein OEV44_02010 [Spirochaetota bacterium]|nr:hypothetical protein [Spirochaetota bacterium]
MLNKLFLIITCLIFSINCSNISKNESTKGYFSDYFVFISSDEGDPLIIPVDINWHQDKPKSISAEFKAWYGTNKPWPIIYDIKKRQLEEKFPVDWTNVKPINKIQWSSNGETIEIDFSNIGKVKLFIKKPDISSTIQNKPDDNIIITSTAVKTKIETANGLRHGWLIHENVRKLSETIKNDSSPSAFSRFHWIPLVYKDNLYLFIKDGKGKQNAIHWYQFMDIVKFKQTNEFNFTETSLNHDLNSKRNDVPTSWKIDIPLWKLTLTLNSNDGHTGYGSINKKGEKALYRQALMTGKTNGNFSVHGMLELILSD